MFYLQRSSADVPIIQVDFRQRTADQLAPGERRAFMYLNSSLEAVNTWLTLLTADPSRSVGTVLEYGKVLLYTLEWLAQEPVRLSTQEPVGHSLLTLQPSDARALLAWLALPAKRETDRHHLVKTGRLPPGFRTHIVSAATRHLRRAALVTFYDWLLNEYLPIDEPIEEPMRHPIRHFDRRLSPRQERGFSDPMARRTGPRPQSLLAPSHRGQNTTGPVALTLQELRLILDTVPTISHGRNAANRNMAFVRLMLWGMLRESEVVGARWEAVDGEQLWVLGKGNKRRVVPIVDVSTWGSLLAYTSELHLPPEQQFHGPFFRQLDHEDRPMTIHTLEHLILALKSHFRHAASVKARTGDPLSAQPLSHLAEKLHLHIFRATGATLMAAAGMNLIKLSLLLGHANPSTTLRYYVAAEQLALPEAVLKICQAITAALETESSVSMQSDLLDPRSWYERRGHLPPSNGRRYE